jgi:hypothetical protein
METVLMVYKKGWNSGTSLFETESSHGKLFDIVMESHEFATSHFSRYPVDSPAEIVKYTA